MKQYIITYLDGDQPSNHDEGKKHFTKYQAWLGSLGEAVVKPMVPFKNVHLVSPDGSITEGSSIAITGYTVIQAESIEEVIEFAKSCPFLDINGSLELAEIVQM